MLEQSDSQKEGPDQNQSQQANPKKPKNPSPAGTRGKCFGDPSNEGSHGWRFTESCMAMIDLSKIVSWITQTTKKEL